MATKIINKEPTLFQEVEDKPSKEIVSYKDLSGARGVIECGPLLGVIEREIVDKSELVGVAFVITNYQFSMGKYGPFCSVEFVAQDGTTGVFNDGSTGICKQLFYLDQELDHPTPLHCKSGLKESNYTYKSDSGVDIPATTYYLT